MCKFASFVLTRESEFWGPTDSHYDIIGKHGLVEDGARGPNIVRVEITPPKDNPKAPLELWDYAVDQDQFPDWNSADPGRSEERARSALARRSSCERWLLSEESQAAVVGYAGTATAGDAGTATAGNRGTATAGDRGTATAGNNGTATAGNNGTATAGDYAILIVKYWDGSRYRVAVGYTGESGIEPGVKYHVVDGKLVAVET